TASELVCRDEPRRIVSDAVLWLSSELLPAPALSPCNLRSAEEGPPPIKKTQQSTPVGNARGIQDKLRKLMCHLGRSAGDVWFGGRAVTDSISADGQWYRASPSNPR